MNSTSEISRRIFANRMAKGFLGCAFSSRFAQAAEPIGNPRADSVIWLFMGGGMSQLDTFDLRPDNRGIQGQVTGIRTSVPGTHITANLPRLAKHMNRIAQIRSMTHGYGNHSQARDHLRSRAVSETAGSGLEIPEPGKIRELYGKSSFGRDCLLARRLVERGSRFVEVELGGWDTHTENHARVARNCAVLDEGLSALLTDLASKGMLERTLVVLTTEFGRSPEINAYGGRNHNPDGFTSLLMGGGVIGGAVYGKTNPDGHGVAEDPVSAQDFNATISHALGCGLPNMVSKETVATVGAPITALFG